MNRNRKIVSGVLSSALAVSMVTPALAATDPASVIDYNRTGTLNIHKIIENDGTLKNADGTAIETDNVALDNIGFDYVRIADVENTTGIVVSENGKVSLGQADSGLSGEVAVGLYFKATDKLDGLMNAAEVFPEPTYIMTQNLIAPDGTLQEAYAQAVANNLLSAEQADVNAKKEALLAAKATLKSAQNDYASSKSQSEAASSSKQSAQTAYNNAVAAQLNAQTAADKAATAAQTAADKFEQASEDYTTASSALDAAQTDYEAKLAAYDTGDASTLKKLEEASSNLKTATANAKAASEAAANAEAAYELAQDNLTKANEAHEAAATILAEANAAHDIAATDTENSETGTANAIAWATEQLNNAQAYLDACQTQFDTATDELAAANTANTNAVTALNAAIAALETATANNSAAYQAFSTSLQSLKTAKTKLSAASAAKDAAETAQTDANTKKANADTALGEANTALENATEALNNASGDAQISSDDLANKSTTKDNAKTAYKQALAAYEAAVETLDATAEANGITKCYTVEALENAWQKAITTLSEEFIAQWVAANAPTGGDGVSEGYTDDNGVVTFSGLPLGLYVVAETDISYHDGIAGAWNDGASGSINNSSTNTYSDGVYSIQPIDAFGDDVLHTYSRGEAYRESVNPEGPIVESKSAPFLVSLPQTRTADADDTQVAAGDEAGATGTVWQYTIDVYPKNQTSAIYKRIVDPDEADGIETLRTSEDYQIGDLIETIIWADAPVLQKNYLFDASDEGFGDGVEGDLADRDDASDSKNAHIGYVIADTMTDGVSFGGVTKVAIIPKSQLETKVPTAANEFDIVYDASDDEGIILDAADYTVIDTDTSDVKMTNSVGDVSTVISAGTHGWAVQLTESGLAKLNARTSDSVVVVYFDSILNSDAAIGQVRQNMNYASLHYVNTNTGFYIDENGEVKGAKKISSNEVYEYTYELQIKKEGVTDASNVKFIVSRDDQGDIAQDTTKDLTDSVSQTKAYGEADSMKFVKESDGVYHVYGYLATEDKSDVAESYETDVVNGVTYNTITPAADGTLILKGLDSNDYEFQEIKTEDENNLLANTFTVSIRANDSETESARNGAIAQATVKSGSSEPIDITIGVVGTSTNDSLGADAKNLGIASMVVNNFDAVDLRTGGAGRTMIYVAGIAMLAGVSVVMFVGKKKRSAEEE